MGINKTQTLLFHHATVKLCNLVEIIQFDDSDIKTT